LEIVDTYERDINRWGGHGVPCWLGRAHGATPPEVEKAPRQCHVRHLGCPTSGRVMGSGYVSHPGGVTPHPAKVCFRGENGQIGAGAAAGWDRENFAAKSVKINDFTLSRKKKSPLAGWD
jgi:hypothetical protein